MREISTTTSLEFILEDECRLDAPHYALSVYQARKILSDAEKKGTKLTTVGNLSDEIFNPPPIKRIFTDDQNRGTPYMLPQEMYDFYWEPRKYVFADKMKDIEDWFLKEDWVVLSQSGTVGKPYYATTNDKDIILSQNAIRIPPKDPKFSGYVYAYLSTWIGQALLKKNKFGITVKHLRPHHVNSVSIPDISKPKKIVISNKIKRAFELRAESIKLIKEAKLQIYKELNAPEKDPSEDEYDEDES